MIVDCIIEKIRTSLKNELPGQKAQFKMMSDFGKRFLDDKCQKPNAARKSAVLILLYPVDAHLFFVLIKRTEDSTVHSGQISFPGGKWEESDYNIVGTALRETSEELGFNTNNVNILGMLTPLFIPVSNYLVQPVVGFLPERPEFFVNQEEVAFIIEVQLDDLLNPENIKKTEKEFHPESGKIVLPVPYYDLNNNEVWGATAMILSEFVDVIK